MMKRWFLLCLILIGLVGCKDERQDRSVSSTPNPHIVMQTNLGTMEFELFKNKSPETVNNFLKYAKKGLYEGTIFHRVIKGFMAQGGGFNEGFEKVKTFDPIKNEASNGLLNERGTLAMARTNQVHSATNQFFINFKHNSFLNHQGKAPMSFGYAVFGKLVKGGDILKKIESLKVKENGGHKHVPLSPVIIKKVMLKK